MSHKRFDLNARVIGPWAPFETEIISLDHVGWPSYLSKTEFKLKLSPFVDWTRDWIYVVDNGLMPPETKCIEVEGKEIKKPIFSDNSIYGRYLKKFYVNDWRPYKITRKKPDYSYKDFIYYCSCNWDFASEDDLDKMIALQLISCPSSIAGNGGLGTLTSKISEMGDFRKQYITGLESSFRHIIPKNFNTKNKLYEFYFLKNNMVNLSKRSKFNASPEINYIKPCRSIDEAIEFPLNSRIQIPLLVKHSKLNKKINECQNEILQYQLSALTYYPQFEDSHLREFERYVKEINDNKSTSLLNADSFAINKLALSFSRLYFEEDISSNIFKEAADLFFKNWEDWNDYLRNSYKLGSYRKKTMANDAKYNLTFKEQDVGVALQRAHDETGELWVEYQYLKDYYIKREQYNLRDILYNLNNMGLVIFKDNTRYVRLIEND